MTETKWNREIVRDYFRYLREGNVDRLFFYSHPDAVLEVPGLAIGGRFVGRHAIRTCLVRMQALFGTRPAPEMASLVADGNMVIADVTLRGRLPNSEAFNFHVLSIFEFRDRKISRQTLFFDTEEVAQQLTKGADAPAAA